MMGVIDVNRATEDDNRNEKPVLNAFRDVTLWQATGASGFMARETGSAARGPVMSQSQASCCVQTRLTTAV